MAARVQAALSDFSLEMTGRDVGHVANAVAVIPAGARVNVAFLENESLEDRLAAARAVLDGGMVPVPHIAARRVPSEAALYEFLAALQSESASDEVFAVAGDPSTPHGPYGDSFELIQSGRLQSFGVRRVSIAGYPEGHPLISRENLWRSLERKAELLAETGMAGSIITQFGFDVDPIVEWVEEVRSRGIDMPIRIGIPGPAGIRRLVRYAARFGVGTSAGIAKKYGFSITHLVGTAGPDKFLHDLAARYRLDTHGDLRLHFYTFGGLEATSRWISEFRDATSQRSA
ncbi:methylenetetrahydrofolate reductase [Nocardia sp. R7R-8]|uniref:methylenetetrahydrofolate reductase n=1 Tax=Nocardia sp. R7R-8 TaxID=3459304 RepID=UPI00403DFAD9